MTSSVCEAPSPGAQTHTLTHTPTPTPPHPHAPAPHTCSPSTDSSAMLEFIRKSPPMLRRLPRPLSERSSMFSLMMRSPGWGGAGGGMCVCVHACVCGAPTQPLKILEPQPTPQPTNPKPPTCNSLEIFQSAQRLERIQVINRQPSHTL